MYGYKSLKWLSRITVTNEVSRILGTAGYSVDAWIGNSNGCDDHSRSPAGAAPRKCCCASMGRSAPRTGQRRAVLRAHRDGHHSLRGATVDLVVAGAHRHIHVYADWRFPSAVVSLSGSWGKGLRATCPLQPWSADDRRWLRLSVKARPEREAGRDALIIGKFNAGQKLNAAFVGGVIVVMLATGAVMHWYSPWPGWRTGPPSRTSGWR